jgi:V/A-type H+-transporting ATPase subunit I
VLFSLLFGMAFADAGYGALMLGASLLALRFWKVSERVRPLLWIPACCGAFSLLFGVLIGVYFGSLPALLFDNAPRLTPLPPGVVRVLSHLLIAENPVGVAAISFLLGSLHLVCTMTAQAIGLCRAHRVKDALLDIVPLAVFFCGLVALIFSWLLGVIVLGCAVVAIFVIGVLAGKGFKDRCRKGLLGFSKLLRYVGMLLFFGRPFALGMVVCALGLACRAIPRVAGAPFFPLLVMLLCLGLTYLVCVVIDLLLDRAHEGGLPCADFFGNFYARRNPAFDPMVASERYAQDASPVQSNSVVEVYDDRT